MSQFYISFIFIGIFFVLLSLALVWLDKRKVFSFVRNYEEKKQEMIEIINDAEQMIEELNKFSDYIVTQMDFKNEELGMNLKKADEQIKELIQKVQDIHLLENKPEEGIIIKEIPEIIKKPDFRQDEELVMNGSIKDGISKYADSLLKLNNSIQNNIPDKVIPINTRHNEVLRLHRSGISDIEIARKLNVGVGEIQLILELNK